MNKVYTKGNVIVNDIKVGDIHYEYEFGIGIKSEVISEPVRSPDGYWVWKSRNLNTGKIIDYGISERYPHYGPNLYDYEAYTVKIYI
jgi:hypothetical protein